MDNLKDVHSPSVQGAATHNMYCLVLAPCKPGALTNNITYSASKSEGSAPCKPGALTNGYPYNPRDGCTQSMNGYAKGGDNDEDDDEDDE